MTAFTSAASRAAASGASFDTRRRRTTASPSAGTALWSALRNWSEAATICSVALLGSILTISPGAGATSFRHDDIASKMDAARADALAIAPIIQRRERVAAGGERDTAA